MPQNAESSVIIDYDAHLIKAESNVHTTNAFIIIIII